MGDCTTNHASRVLQLGEPGHGRSELESHTMYSKLQEEPINSHIVMSISHDTPTMQNHSRDLGRDGIGRGNPAFHRI
jgi:hypothetical protein